MQLQPATAALHFIISETVRPGESGTTNARTLGGRHVLERCPEGRCSFLQERQAFLAHAMLSLPLPFSLG
eukprot:1144232-Pelagomonas_calceolata.AAC.6